MLDGVDPGPHGSLDARVPLGMGDRPPKRLVRLVDAGCQLHLGEGGGAWVDAGGHPAAGGRELDAVGAGLELLAHRAPHVVGPVGLPADEPAMAPRHADDGPGRAHPRPGYAASGDRLAEPDGHARPRTDVADAGDADREGLPGVRRGGPGEVGHRNRRGPLHLLGLGGEREVHVAVDEPRHERSPLELDDLGVADGDGAAHARDPAAFQHDIDARARRGAGSIDEARIADDRPA